MKKNQSKMAIDIPAMETTAEGKLRGGFTSVGNEGISVCGGPNDKCGNNGACSDNGVCYDNSDSQACAGNHSTGCSSNTPKPTQPSEVDPTPISTDPSEMMTNIFPFF